MVKVDVAWARVRAARTDRELYLLAQVAPVLSFWVMGAAFALLDVLQLRAAKEWRCQPSAEIDWKAVRKCVVRTLFNYLFVYPVAAATLWPVVRARLDFSARLPRFRSVLKQFALATVLTEVEFYYIHRLLHHPRLYPSVHKTHHEIKAPFGFCALYFHPFEFFLSVCEALLPCCVLRTHVLVMSTWATLATSLVVVHHSGYELPGIPDTIPGFDSMTKQHDDHHKQFNVCFGVLGVLDRLHGTGSSVAKKAGDAQANKCV